MKQKKMIATKVILSGLLRGGKMQYNGITFQMRKTKKGYYLHAFYSLYPISMRQVSKQGYYYNENLETVIANYFFALKEKLNQFKYQKAFYEKWYYILQPLQANEEYQKAVSEFAESAKITDDFLSLSQSDCEKWDKWLSDNLSRWQ